MLWRMSDTTDASSPTNTGDAISPRLSNGRFKPGHSGNPGGRPKLPMALRDGMRSLADDAMRVLEDALASEDERVRLMAAAQILDRGYGKPNQTVDMNARVNSADIVKAGHERARALRKGSGQ